MSPSLPRPSKADLALWVFVALSAVHLVAQTLTDRRLADLSQVLLMLPLLAWLFLASAAPRSNSTWLAGVGLLFSWLGDSAPRFLEQPTAFWSMVGFFFVAQLGYVAALRPVSDRSVLGGKRNVVITLLGVAVLGIVGASVFVAPAAGVIVGYASAILAMALLATGLGREGLLGGLLFVISDAMIALRTFGGLEIPLSGVWVMLTYLSAQAFLTRGFIGLAQETSAARN